MGQITYLKTPNYFYYYLITVLYLSRSITRIVSLYVVDEVANKFQFERRAQHPANISGCVRDTIVIG